MSGEICTDNRFEIIASYKKVLVESTNIETSPDEMAVIDNVLFRFWQMGWLNPHKTNADRIRNMSDEELASKFADIYCPDGLSENHKNCKHNYLTGSPIEICEECWLEWLKQEVSNG